MSIYKSNPISNPFPDKKPRESLRHGFDIVITTASMKFRFGVSAAALLLCSCIFSESKSDAPFPGSPEAVLQSMSAKWKVNAKRSYAIDYETSSADGTTTFTCRADKGVLTGQCLSVYVCCGGNPESTYVNPPYPVPGELLSSLAREVSLLNYEGGTSTGTSIMVFRSSVSDSGKVDVGYNAAFDGELGYPILIESFGFAETYNLRIRRIEFL